jgi:hypothetical protein
MIKEVLDKKFGPSWHVVVGEGFGFEISYEVSGSLDFNGMKAVHRIRMDTSRTISSDLPQGRLQRGDSAPT